MNDIKRRLLHTAGRLDPGLGVGDSFVRRKLGHAEVDAGLIEVAIRMAARTVRSRETVTTRNST
ncbi:MAG TPA: hypothetical protein VGO67_14830 [Verrucomicrobiae bacterium]